MPDPPVNAVRPDAWIRDALRDLQAEGLRRRRRVGVGGPHVDFGSNDYLGLAGNAQLAAAANAAAAEQGWGAGASPVVAGRSSVHAALEQQIARFEGVPAALLFPSGYAANSAVIPTLVGEGDAIFTDAKNHASIIDGCRLSPARRHVYRHGDAEHLAQLLGDASSSGRRLIVTDTLFSMDGDFAPLAEIARLALEHECMLMVDEAHATGVWGPGGRGAIEHFAAQEPLVEQAVTVRVGTLSKAIGSAGGFVAGSEPLIEWLHNRARAYVYSTAQPAAVAAASAEGLRLVDAEPERRERVRRLAESLRGRLLGDGWETGPSVSQIVPILVGDAERAVRLSERLAEAGLFVPAIRPPSVPAGQSLLRVSVSAAHTDRDLDRLVRTLHSARSV
ncbi:MAG: 8-amino-7-oxononanoate synthase [Planctomycetota bacterium]